MLKRMAIRVDPQRIGVLIWRDFLQMSRLYLLPPNAGKGLRIMRFAPYLWQ
jgi:hypothetical protein